MLQDRRKIQESQDKIRALRQTGESGLVMWPLEMEIQH